MSTFILPSETFQVRLFGIEPHVDRRASKNRAFTVMTFRTHTAKSTQSPFEGSSPKFLQKESSYFMVWKYLCIIVFTVGYPLSKHRKEVEAVENEAAVV